MYKILEQVLDREALSAGICEQFIHDINENKLSAESVAATLITIEARGAQLEEIQGFRRALIDLSIKPQLEFEYAIDLCGTGGDSKGTFNISTCSSMVLAALGYKVIKHGNYGVSSLCGSSNVLEALGVKLNLSAEDLQRNLDEHNICFLHAPNYHPVLKKVAPIRANMGIRTIFNGLGPLVNPVQPNYQLTGTYSLELARLYQHILRSERSNFNVVYGFDGFDELSLTENTRTLGKRTDRILNAKSIGTNAVDIESLQVKSKNEASQVLLDVLQGKGSDAQLAVVAANVALARETMEEVGSLQELFNDSLEFIRSGESIKTLKKLL